MVNRNLFVNTVSTATANIEYDFSVCKMCSSSSATPRYQIRDEILIYCCSACGAHYINHLDTIQSDATEKIHVQSDVRLSASEFEYIAKQLQSNKKRFSGRVDLLMEHCQSFDLKLLDVGAGGGLFLHLLKERGIDVFGIEPNPMRVQFAEQRYGLSLSHSLVEDEYWQRGYAQFFDAVTLWDVIEHVNFPRDLLVNINNLLKDDGILLLDTPARDTFYYRVGNLSYRLTFGLFPLFLNMMYSKAEFAHKQIFSSSQLTRLLQESGFEVLYLEKIHELSFPFSHYLKRLFRSERIARICQPVFRLIFRYFKIQNKMILVARKQTHFKLGKLGQPNLS